MHLMRRETFSQTLVWMPMCCSTSCSSICLSRMSSMSMQQVRLCSASVENSVCRLVGASSSEMADVLPESSSTTGAVGEKNTCDSTAKQLPSENTYKWNCVAADWPFPLCSPCTASSVFWPIAAGPADPSPFHALARAVCRTS